ncbi:GH12167 [Drosophila grimshawi]|uniref:GH12167 n=2 Tax=Drosophila grimshawi TaxID=7222 RepID=B4JJW6_DROGR|nr:GH12167 [Drosophila grimshawi]
MDVEHEQQSSATAGGNEGKAEESLGISTSSSWTILATDRVETLDNTTDNEQRKGQRQPERGDHQQSDSNEHTNERLVDDLDGQTEDVSDGISIISDCESTGRISPHPFLRELNIKFELGDELPPSIRNLSEHGGAQQVRERQITASELDGVAQPQTALSHKSHPDSELTNPKILVGYRLPKLVENGLTAVFYVGATLAILAFIGRLRNPEWKVLGGDGAGGGDNALEQRLVELELQTNLMRAEIDIMSKQLLYLNSLTPGQSQSPSKSDSQSKYQQRKAVKFGAWTGNGNSMDAVEITKDDLKRPYKCPDGKYVEIAAMCIEKEPHAESLADEIGNVVNDVLQQSQAFHNFEKVTERLDTIAGITGDTPNTFQELGGEEVRTPPPPPPSDPKHYVPVESKERYRKKHTHKLKNDGDQQQQQSKEYLDQRSKKYDSKERYTKHYAKRHHRQDDDSGSGEWHERRMQHREHSRTQHEQRRNNNWYIERGDSREQKRSGQMRR